VERSLSRRAANQPRRSRRPRRARRWRDWFPSIIATVSTPARRWPISPCCRPR
jgi:hypothetical protein